MITLVGRDDFGKEIRFTLSQIKSLGWSKRSMCIQADEYEVIDPETVECANCAGLREQLSDYEEAARSRDNLVRQLDVIWNGEAGAAKQARLCDIVSQIEVEVPKLREQIKVLREQIKVLRESLEASVDLLSKLENIGGFIGLAVISNGQTVLEQIRPKEGE